MNEPVMALWFVLGPAVAFGTALYLTDGAHRSARQIAVLGLACFLFAPLVVLGWIVFVLMWLGGGVADWKREILRERPTHCDAALDAARREVDALTPEDG